MMADLFLEMSPCCVLINDERLALGFRTGISSSGYVSALLQAVLTAYSCELPGTCITD